MSDRLEKLYGLSASDPVTDAKTAATEAAQAAQELGLPKPLVEATQAQAIARVVSHYHGRRN